MTGLGDCLYEMIDDHLNGSLFPIDPKIILLNPTKYIN